MRRRMEAWTCVGEMRVLTDDGCVREKLFILSLAAPFF